MVTQEYIDIRAKVDRIDTVREKIKEHLFKKIRKGYAAFQEKFKKLYLEKYKKLPKYAWRQDLYDLDKDIYKSSIDVEETKSLLNFSLTSKLWDIAYNLRRKHRIVDSKIEIRYLTQGDSILVDYPPSYTDGWYCLGCGHAGFPHNDPCGPFDSEEYAFEFARFVSWGNE